MSNVVEQTHQQERPCLDALRIFCQRQTSEDTISKINRVADVIELFCLLNVFILADKRNFHAVKSNSEFRGEIKVLVLDAFTKIEGFEFVPKIDLSAKVFFLSAVKESVSLREDQFSPITEQLFSLICE